MILGDVTVHLTDAGKAAILNQAKVSPAAVGKLFGATVDLFVAPVTPTGATAAGDLTLPTWTGYTSEPVTWHNAAPVQVDIVQMDGDSVAFNLPTGAVGQSIYGYAISDTTPQVVAVAVLNQPELIYHADTALVVPFIPFDTSAA